MKLRKNKKEWDADTPITPAGVNTKCTSYSIHLFGYVYGPQLQQIPVAIFTLTQNADLSIKANNISVALKSTRIQ